MHSMFFQMEAESINLFANEKNNQPLKNKQANKLPHPKTN